MKFFTLLILTFTVTFLSSCGFTPVYHDNERVQKSFDNVYVKTIPNRDGQYLRNKLLDSFYESYSQKDKRYTLSVTDLSIEKTDLDITKGADATRAQLRVRSNVELIDTELKKTVLKRQVTSITSYNILDSQFTTRVSEKTARENALIDMAGQIQRYVSLHFMD